MILNEYKLSFQSDKKISPNFIILGNKYINSKSLIYKLNQNLEFNYNKSNFNLISNILNKQKLIKTFIIHKTSNNLFTIRIKEKNIIGLTKIKNNDYLIDELNNLIKFKVTPDLSHLPIFIGKNSNKGANIVLRLLKESDIDFNYISLTFIDNRRWNINLNNGVKILLPEINILETLKLLKKINIEYNILNGNFVEIDLRVHGKYFLKPKIN